MGQVYDKLPAGMIDPQTGALKLTDWTNVRATLIPNGVHDGDTYKFTVQTDYGPQTVTVRPAVINAPEYSKGMIQDDGFQTGKKATDYAAAYFANNPNVTLTLKPEIDSYNRNVGFVHGDSQPESINYYMVEGGYAWIDERRGASTLEYNPANANQLLGDGTLSPSDLAKYQQALANAKNKGIWQNPNPNTPPNVFRDLQNQKNEAESIRVVLRLSTSDDQAIAGLKAWRDDKPLSVGESDSKVEDSWYPDVKSATYKVKASGYKVVTVPVSREDQLVPGARIEKPVPLAKEGSSRSVSIAFVSGSDSVPGLQASFNGETKTVDANNPEALVWENVPDGEKTVQWSPSEGDSVSWEAGSKSVTVSEGNDNFTIDISKAGDADSAIVENPGSDADKAASAQSLSLSSVTLPAVDAEERNLNQDAYLGYYTSAQTKMFIGDLFIDEMVSIEWSINDNAVPLFGYASKFADAYAEGRSLIQGQIMLNYTAPWYLGVALANHLAIQARKEGQDDPNVIQLAYLLMQNKVPANPEDFTPEQIEAAKKIASRELGGARTTPAVYKRIPFNILLQFGDSQLNRRQLRDCKLTSYNQIVDQSGNPIFESYGFLARDAI